MQIITVQNLTKEYILGKSNFLSFYNENFRSTNVKKITALNKLNFNINQSEKIALIGKNGSGKSTLCKILSRVTYPTDGKILINGKVSSVLEAGAGFHPDLTGRENIFLAGAILGMNKNRIEKKFDQIVSFSELNGQIDTPVKKYSLGMGIKLAFSICTFLEGDILILDEVLAFADEKFRKKATSKITEKITNENKTLILVSHDKRNLLEVCEKAILIDEGNILNIDKPEKIIQEYEKLIIK